MCETVRISSLGGTWGYITALQWGPLVLFHMGAPKVSRDPTVFREQLSLMCGFVTALGVTIYLMQNHMAESWFKMHKSYKEVLWYYGISIELD